MRVREKLFETGKFPFNQAVIFTLFTKTIMYLVYPSKFYITIVSSFSLVLQSFQEKSKTIVMQNFWGVNKVHYGLGEKSECSVFNTMLRTQDFKLPAKYNKKAGNQTARDFFRFCFSSIFL